MKWRIRQSWDGDVHYGIALLSMMSFIVFARRCQSCIDQDVFDLGILLLIEVNSCASLRAT